MRAEIEAAGPEDLAGVLELLRKTSLPTEGVSEHISSGIVARSEGAIVASALLEIYEDGALLRSVAVDPSSRGTGLGIRVTEAALAMARRLGVPAAFLLTTTAEGFFPRFGFTRIERGEVPSTLQQSIEFQSACPTSATVMRKVLFDDTHR